MNKRTFEQAFNTIFHDDEAFSEFCSMKINDGMEEFKIKERTIFKTSEKLKKYLRFIDRVLLSHLQKNDEIVHSYIKEKSALTAVKAHSNNKYFFKTDIQDFYSKITNDDIDRILRRDELLIPISDFKDFIPKIVEFTTWKGSIPVGFATSPKLSNAFLLEFDSALQQFCTDKGVICTRYSDDIIISGDSFDRLDGLEEHIQELLWSYASNSLYLNKKKTQRTHTGNKVKILGLVITPSGRVTIDSKYKNKLESLIHFYINDKAKYEDILNKEFKGSEHSLFGLLHYAKSIDPKYLEKLQQKYGAYVLSVFMEDKKG